MDVGKLIYRIKAAQNTEYIEFFCRENESKENILPRCDALLQDAKKAMHPAETSISLVSVT